MAATVTHHTGVVVKASRDCCTINHTGLGSLKFHEADCRTPPARGCVKFGEDLKGRTVTYTLTVDGPNVKISDVRRVGT